MLCPKCKNENPPDSKYCKECGTQLIQTAKADASFTKTIEISGEDLTRGTLFADRYEIIEELGRGGMAQMKIDFLLDSVRSDPRFKEILKKINLE